MNEDVPSFESIINKYKFEIRKMNIDDLLDEYYYARCNFHDACDSYSDTDDRIHVAWLYLHAVQEEVRCRTDSLVPEELEK